MISIIFLISFLFDAGCDSTAARVERAWMEIYKAWRAHLGFRRASV